MLIWRLFLFKVTATPDIYTLSLHDALPILRLDGQQPGTLLCLFAGQVLGTHDLESVTTGEDVGHADCRLLDRKSTRLNSSHANISYAVFCLKKKKNIAGEHGRDISP